MKTISRNESIGNTFSALVASAFPDSYSIVIDPFMQYGSCGTVVIDGQGFDWHDRGDSVDFERAF